MEFQMAPENELTKNESMGLSVKLGPSEGKEPVSVRIVFDVFRKLGYGYDGYKDCPEFLRPASDYEHFERNVEKFQNELEHLKPLAKTFFETQQL